MLLAGTIGVVDAAMTALGNLRDELERVRAAASTMPELSGAPAAGGHDQLTPLMTAEDVAEHFRVTVGTINGWCADGLFTDAQPLGRAGWRIPVPSVLACQ